MRKSFLPWVVLGVIPVLASCNILAPLAVMGEHRKKVQPEFDKLGGKRVAVLVWTDPATLFDYPFTRFELATYVGDKLHSEMAQRNLATEVVDPRDVEDFLQKNLDARIDPHAVGRQFKADYVVYLEVVGFQIRDPNEPQFLRGRVNASVSVHDVHADPDSLRRFELTPVECVYPDDRPVLMTAVAAILGVLPLVLAGGQAGKELLQPIAVVITGGLISSTLLDWTVTPALFYKFGKPVCDYYLSGKEAEEHIPQGFEPELSPGSAD